MKLRFLFLAVALLSAQPALAAATLVNQAHAAIKAERYADAEQLLRRHLRSHKTDEKARFLLARVLSWQGKRREALVEYDALIKADPRDGDYLVGKAQTLVWDGKPAQALPLLSRARRIAPRYEYVWRLQVEALIALGDESRMRQARLIRAEAAKRFPRSDWRFAALDGPSSPPKPVAGVAAPPEPPSKIVPGVSAGDTRPKIQDAPPTAAAITPPEAAAPDAAKAETRPGTGAVPPAFQGIRLKRSELEFGTRYEDLSGGLASWRDVYLYGAHQLGERFVLYGTLHEARRFGMADSEVQGGFYYPLGETWTSVIEASYSPTRNFFPSYSLLGQLHKALGHGWNVQAGLRYNEYPTLHTHAAVLTGERYWSNFRGSYSLYVGSLDGRNAPSHIAQFDVYYGERSSIGAVVQIGREITDRTPVGVLITDVHSYALRGRHWLTPDWALTYEALYHEQGGLYTRQGARIGLRRAF